jgi:hypothetical protein
MKHFLFLVALIFGLVTIPISSFAKDKHEDDWHKEDKRVRNDYKALETHYGQVEERIRVLGGGDRRLWAGLQQIRSNIDRIRYDIGGDRYDTRDARYRIQQSDDDLGRLQAQMEYNNKQPRRGGYYRPY